MRSLALLIALTVTVAHAQDIPITSDAPIVVDQPGQSIRVNAGDVAAFNGRLLSDEEQLRRAKVGVRNAVELEFYKKPENVTLPKAGLIAITVGSAVVASVITGLVVGLVKAGQPPQPANPSQPVN